MPINYISGGYWSTCINMKFDQIIKSWKYFHNFKIIIDKSNRAHVACMTELLNKLYLHMSNLILMGVLRKFHQI